MSHLHISTITFNCGRERVKPAVFARHLLSAIPPSQPPDLLILCLQEIAPLSPSFLGGSYLGPYYHSLRQAVRLVAAQLEDANYVHLIVRNVGMTAIMAFVLQQNVGRLKWIQTAGVGVGMCEMGNKGAVGLRIAYLVNETEKNRNEDEETAGEIMEISVVAAHLAPMEQAVDRRNEDWKSIVQRLVFTSQNQNSRAHNSNNQSEKRWEEDDGDENAPLLSPPDTSTTTTTTANATTKPQASGLFTPTSHLIFAGDLNYRTSDSKPTQADIQSYPQLTPSGDLSNPKHLSNLFKRDQLRREMKAGRTCHGLQEPSVDFPPTYKYSDRQRALADKVVVDDQHNITLDNQNEPQPQPQPQPDSPPSPSSSLTQNSAWAPHRWPSWCDRILYLPSPSSSPSSPSPIKINKYTSLPLMSTSDHQPVILSLSIPLCPLSLSPFSPSPPSLSSAPSSPSPSPPSSPNLPPSIPPFPIDPTWKSKRARARKFEIVVGYLLLLYYSISISISTTKNLMFLLGAFLVVMLLVSGIVGGWWW